MPVQCRQHTVHPGDAVVVQQHPHPNASIGGLVHGFQQQGSRSVAVPDIILDIETADGGARQQSAGGEGVTAVVQLVNARMRSEEHTSELQSLLRISYAVFCLKTKITINETQNTKNISTRYH